MELKHAEKVDARYRLQFEDIVDNQVLKIKVEFYEKWSLTDQTKKDKLLTDLGDAVSFYLMGEERSFPYEIKNKLTTIPLHIPHALGRQLFKLCFDFFIEQTDAPAYVSIVEHPGYPLTLVTWDTSIIYRGDTIKRWIETIMSAIKECNFTLEKIEKVALEIEDELDEADENVIIEFELDEELKELMKEPEETKWEQIDRKLINDPKEGVENID